MEFRNPFLHQVFHFQDFHVLLQFYGLKQLIEGILSSLK